MNNNRFSPKIILADRYEIKSFHAAGGMQEVYLCYDIALDRNVVLKTPKIGVNDRRFKRGAEMGARINHPNVAATFDYFENEIYTFMIEEYISGKDLGQRLSNEFFFLDPSLAAHVTHHISRALHEAHRVGICHRDLKPSNIMASNDAGFEIIKLTDFGIAKLAENEIAIEMELFDRDESTLTSSNTLLGAVPYMAPECWNDWKGAGQPMDIWALGCIAYQLLSGKAPFGIGRAAIFNVARAEQKGKVELQRPQWLGQHNSTKGLEDELYSLILACLEINPDNRPKAADVLSACGSLCYAASPRRLGIIDDYNIQYPNGGRSKSGYITENVTGHRYFFHKDDFFSLTVPEIVQQVSYSVYPGVPKDRCSPVLLVPKNNT